MATRPEFGKPAYGFRMNKPLPVIALLGLSVVILTGCEQARQALGQTKQSPDEFAVFSRAPLSLPPDYALRPPRPGAERPQKVNPRDRLRQAIAASGGPRTAAKQPAPTGLSPGEAAVLKSAGALNTDPLIRGIINRESTLLAAESRTLTDKIVFWRDPAEFGTTVDAQKEARRLRDRQALGEPLNQGKVPTISRKKKALFEGVFN